MRLIILTLLSIVVASILLFMSKRKTPTTIAAGEGLIVDRQWLVVNKNPVTPKEHSRPADQTFLTYPEWFLVHSPAEQAAYFENHTSTRFPFMNHVSQFWSSYKVVYEQIKEAFQFNTGYHFMIMVIGASTTVEYSIKALYETLVGRMTDTDESEQMTEEDLFNAQFTRDYVDFIRVRPWYEFDFKSRLFKLWTETSFFGSNFIRKCERKYILTSELLVKYGYGWLTKLGTKSIYGEALPTTAVVADNLPMNIEEKLPDLKVLETYPDGSSLILLPRYAAFAPNIAELAAQDVTFREIAGNNSALLMTLLALIDWTISSENFRVLFTQPMATRHKEKRVAIVTTVPLLNKALDEIVERGVAIEHVYDY